MRAGPLNGAVSSGRDTDPSAAGHTTDSTPRRRSRRTQLLRRVGGAMLCVMILLVAHGTLVVPRLIDQRELQVRLPRLPDGWAGQQVAVLSDLQVGMWGANLGTIERMVARIVLRRPAVVLVAGDLLYSTDPDPALQLDTVIRLLQPLLDARLPVVVVLGNHDHRTGHAQEMTDGLEKAGVRVLSNTSTKVLLPGEAEPLHVVGIGPYRAGLSHPRTAVRTVPQDAARVVVMHNPVSFLALPAGTAPLAFAGHTHCGQVVLPVGDGLSALELRAEEQYVIGGWAPREHGAEGNRLYVTCGVGFSRLPMRLGARPQLVFTILLQEREPR